MYNSSYSICSDFDSIKFIDVDITHGRNQKVVVLVKWKLGGVIVVGRKKERTRVPMKKKDF